MKNKNNKNKQHKHSIHQRVEYISRHRAVLLVVLTLMVMAIASFDSRLRSVLREAYAEGFAWVGTYMHHEHPTHAHNSAVATARIPTIAGPG